MSSRADRVDQHDSGQAFNDAHRYLLALAHRNAAVYEALPGTRAIIVMGSVASGHCEQHMPQVDTAQARQKLARHQHIWTAVT